MISLDMAKRLKDAGLKWEPKVRDFAYDHSGNIGLTDAQGIQEVVAWEKNNGRPFNLEYQLVSVAFAPRLDQLLAEIEKREYNVDSEQLDGAKTYIASIWKLDPMPIGLFQKDFESKSREDAAALALEWILKGEA